MLRVPVTSKELEDGSSSSSSWPAFGFAAMQGWRVRMEDAHLALPDFDKAQQTALFGVFDGHGGAAVAKVVSEKLPELLLANSHYKKGNYREALHSVFFEMDKFLDSKPARRDIVQRSAQYPASPMDEEEDEEEEMMDFPGFGEEGGESEMPLEDSEEAMAEDGESEDGLMPGVRDSAQDSFQLWMSGEGPDSMGTTAVVALVCKKTQEVFVANAGDSRCVLVSNIKASDLSEDHKPMLPAEKLRIQKAGGRVLNPEDGGRVDGNLSLSRAFADFAYKCDKNLKASEQKISCEPEIRHHKLAAHDDFLVLGCDGIWEKATSQQVADFLKPHYSSGANSRPLSRTCAAFLDHNLAKTTMSDQGYGCDNMTLMAVDLRGRGKAAQTPATATSSVRSPLANATRKAAPRISDKAQMIDTFDRVCRCSRSQRRRLALQWRQIIKLSKRSRRS